MLTPIQFAFIMLGVLLFALILFGLTGFIHVSKGKVALIERRKMFVGVLKPGWYYFPPLFYKKVRMYKVGEINENIKIDYLCCQINYEIIDIKKFHYIGKDNIKNILEESIKVSPASLKENLDKKCYIIGVKLIDLEIINNAD